MSARDLRTPELMSHNSSTNRTAQICGVQMAPLLGNLTRNTEVIESELRSAAEEKAELIVFPEAALTGYVFESWREGLAYSVKADGPELNRLARATKETGVFIVVGAIEQEDDVLFNSAFLLGPDGVIGRYRKVHTLCLGADRFTRPGGEPFQVYSLPFGRIGLHICYDGWFPESARALRLEGAELLILPTNWPRLALTQEMVKIRAFENRAFYLAVNRVGEERGILFEGGSAAADPFGQLLLEGGNRAGRFHVEMDLSKTKESLEVVRAGEYELDRIEDRWPELYGPITIERPNASRTGSQRSR